MYLSDLPTLNQLRLWGAEIMNSSFNELALLKEWDSQEKAKVTNFKSRVKGRTPTRRK